MKIAIILINGLLHFVRSKLREYFRNSCFHFDYATYKRKAACIRRKAGYVTFLFQSPRYANVGDLAIAEAERLWLPKNVVEIYSDTYEYVSNKKQAKIRSLVQVSDLVTVTGGGFLGAIYPHSERLVRERIVNAFPHNKIIILPQTFYYPHGRASAQELARSKTVYGGHKDITIFARESQTYKLLKKEFTGADIRFMPDMVLGFRKGGCLSESVGRKGKALVLFRSDIERVKDEEQYKHAALQHLSKKGYAFIFDDTCKKRFFVQANRRKPMVHKFLRKMQGADVVLTDRLHGMIFAAITGTPCLAIDNISGKVGAVYWDWLCGIDNIALCREGEHAEELLDKILSLGRFEFANERYMPYFENLRKECSAPVVSFRK